MPAVIMYAVIGIIALYALTTAGMYLFQRRLMYHPDKPIITPYRHMSPELEQVTLQTKDGLKLTSFYHAPQQDKDGRVLPTVIYMHGNTGTAGDAAHKLIDIANAGYGVLLMEYRGFGNNEGKPTEQGLIADAESALHFIHLKQGKDARVIYYGMSMGTGVANGLAAIRPPAGLILECGFTSMTEAAQVRYPIFPLKYLIKDSYQSQDRIPSLTAPLLIMHGELDRTVPVAMGKAMFATATTADKTLKLYPEGHHIDLYDFGNSRDVVDWLDKRFK